MFKFITGKITEFKTDVRKAHFVTLACMYWLLRFGNTAEYFRTADPSQPLDPDAVARAITEDTAAMTGWDVDYILEIQQQVSEDLLMYCQERREQALARKHGVLDMPKQVVLEYYIKQIEKSLRQRAPSAAAN